MSLKVISLNLVMYFGCQIDEPYGIPGEHQPDATMPYWYLPRISVIVFLLCAVGNKTSFSSSSSSSSSSYYYYYYYYYYFTLYNKRNLEYCAIGKHYGFWVGWSTLCFHFSSLQWRHNAHDGVSNHQPHDCLLRRLFRRRSKKTSKLRVTGLFFFLGGGGFTGDCGNAENVSIWWRHHVDTMLTQYQVNIFYLK